jgi:hypothetical protein
MVIFKYNAVSKQHFKLDDVRRELGDAFEIYRMRKDGRLDQEFDDTWNCVAIHKDSPFAAASRQWIVSANAPAALAAPATA